MFAGISPFERARAALSTIDTTSNLQRARGTLRLGFAVRDGGTRPMEIYQEGALKVRFPNVPRGEMPHAVVINTAGGLTGGDRFDITVTLQPGAASAIPTQACEKIYRSGGGAAEIAARAELHPGARLEWLAQPTILFDQARMRRTMKVDMAEDATLLAVEGVIFGRSAMNEVVTSGQVIDGWQVSRAGKLIYADVFRMIGRIDATLARSSVLAGHRAMATMVYVAQDAEVRREEMRALLAPLQCVAATSAWNGMLVTRFSAVDGYGLTHSLTQVLTAFRRAPLPRAWLM